MKNIRIKTLLALAGMFILGSVTGWFQGRHYPPTSILHPTTSAVLEDHIVTRLKSKLSLDTDQVVKIRPMIGPVAAQIVQAQNEMLDKIALILASRDDQITPVLTPEQQSKLQDMKQQRKKFLEHSN